MYSDQGFKVNGFHPLVAAFQGSAEKRAPQASQVVTLRSVEIPEIVENLKGFQRLQEKSDEAAALHQLKKLPDLENFSSLALRVRDAITSFVSDCVTQREQIGFQSIQARQVSRHDADEAFEAKELIQELEELESQLEQKLIANPESAFLAEAIPHVHEQLGDVMHLVRAAWDGSVIREDMIEVVAYQLLDLRALLTSVALEGQSRAMAEQIQSDLQVSQLQQGSDARVLTVANDSLLGLEMVRQQELQRDVLPQIHRAVSPVANALIDFISELRDQEPAPFGFSLAQPQRSEPPTTGKVIEALERGTEQLEEIFGALDTPAPMDVNYRAYLHGIGHHMSMLRVALLRQNAQGVISQSSLSMVQSQCEATLRKITTGLKQLTDVAAADLQAAITQGMAEGLNEAV